MQPQFFEYRGNYYSTPDAARAYIKFKGGIVKKDEDTGNEHVGSVGNKAIKAKYGEGTSHWKKFDINASADNGKLFDFLRGSGLATKHSLSDGKVDLWDPIAFKVVLEEHCVPMPNGIQVLENLSELELTLISQVKPRSTLSKYFDKKPEEPTRARRNEHIQGYLETQNLTPVEREFAEKHIHGYNSYKGLKAKEKKCRS